MVYIYAWQQHNYQWPDSFRKSSRIWHLNVSFFQQCGNFPFFIIFFPKLRRYSQRSYNSKNHPIGTNSKTPREFELYELNCIVNKINKTIAFFVYFRTSYQENRYLQYTNPLSDHTFIMVTLFTTKLIIPLSIKNWNHFNTIPRNAVQFVALRKKRFIMN